MSKLRCDKIHRSCNRLGKIVFNNIKKIHKKKHMESRAFFLARYFSYYSSFHLKGDRNVKEIS